MRDDTPLQHKFEFALWTLAIIRELISKRFGVKLSEVSVGRLMKRLGFTPQRPLYRAWQQDEELVAQWREQEFPKIAARAKREGAVVVLFADESGIRSDHHAGTTWAPQGHTPVVKATGARYGFNMLSAISATGQLRFMTVEGRVNGTVFRDFLGRLITGMDRKIFLVVDQGAQVDPRGQPSSSGWSGLGRLVVSARLAHPEGAPVLRLAHHGRQPRVPA